MNLTVLTPEKELYSGSVTSVQVPGSAGQFEILKGHAPIVSKLDNGIIRIKAENGDKAELEIEQGFLEVIRDEINILVTQVSTE